MAKKLLDKPATKGDLTNLVTKIEVKKTERILRAEVLRVEEKVENIEEGQKRMETTLNKISN